MEFVKIIIVYYTPCQVSENKNLYRIYSSITGYEMFDPRYSSNAYILYYKLMIKYV